MSAKPPWEITPALTPDRLAVLDYVFRSVRKDALKGHEPSKGDNEWVFGTKAYARTCAKFFQLFLSGQYPWLKVEFDNNACTLRVGGHAIKFYKGDPEKPSARSVNGAINIAQPSLPGIGSEDSEWFWLIAIVTRPNGTVARVVVVQANEFSETKNPYVIPETTTLDTPVVVPIRREGVDLPPPKVGQRRPDDSEETDDGIAGDVGNK